MASGGKLRSTIQTGFKFRRIPDKWKDYAACGKPIPGERLVSFKTPLSEEYHYTGEGEIEDSLQKEEEFTPGNLCEIIRKYDNKLGLVVDFTNTNRYYNPKMFTNDGVEYNKIKCEGRIVPSEKVVTQCKSTILSFLRRFPTSNSLIGLHCTHGLNRAGYIVCRYLIDCKGYKPDDAIKAFNKARGYEMEREHYINDLKERTPTLLSEVDVDLFLNAPLSDEAKMPQDYRADRSNDTSEYHNGGIRSGTRRQSDRDPCPSRRPNERNEEWRNQDRHKHNGSHWSNWRRDNDYREYRLDYWENDREPRGYQEPRRYQGNWKPREYNKGPAYEQRPWEQRPMEPRDRERYLNRRNDSPW